MKSKKLFLFALLSFLPFVSASSFAVACDYASGPKEVTVDISNSFTSANNTPGSTVLVTPAGVAGGTQAKCPLFTPAPPNEAGTTTWRTYRTNFPVESTDGNKKYISLNDYLSVATVIKDNYTGDFYPPADFIRMGGHYAVPIQGAFPVTDSNFRFYFRVKKSFINFLNIPKKTLFNVYVNTFPNEQLGSVVYTITYSGFINVPQTCVLNTDQIIEFDFGEIGAQLFSRAGAGNPALYINPMTKTVDIKCTNIAAGTAQLALRVEAEKTNGNIIVSDNADVGFKMSASDMNGSQHTFIPNNINDRIGFKLDDSGRGNINITVVPVSVTGNMPQPGIFTARGYLRVDFF